MAIKIPIITELQDEGIKRAKREFDKFKGAVASAEGGMGKLKAGSKVAFDAMSANAATFATAAAGAVITFAAKGITAFRDLALSADKFANATGLAVEDASRLIEVTGDLGIEAATVETAIGKMNQNLGKSPDLFKDLGVQVAYAKDGTVDANKTFLNVIDRLNKIKDPAEKARVATQLLGKGWRDMSQLIGMGADSLRASLASVSDAKIISAEEAAKAKKFRDNMDNLKDTVEDLSLQIGEVLVPAISDVVEQINKMNVGGIGGGFLQSFFGSPMDKFKGTMQMAKGVVQAFGFAKDDATSDDPLISEEEIKNMKQAALDLEQVNQQTLNQIKYGKLRPFKETTESADRLRIQLQNVAEKWDYLTGRLDQTVAFDHAELKLVELEAAAAKAFGSGTQEDLRIYNQLAADFAGLLAIISEGMGDISSRQIQIRFETKGFAEALALAKFFKGGAELMGLSQADLLTFAGISTLPARAMGGTVSAGGTYVVGERGPELLTVGAGGGHVSQMGGGGNTINISVTSADPNQVVAAIQQWSRNNGAVPLATTTNIRR